MKRSIHLKIIVVLGYVALCTMLVVAEQQADAPVQGAQQAVGADFPDYE